MLLNCGIREDSWESLGMQGDQTCLLQRKSVLTIHFKGWRWNWSSNTLATWCEVLTHWKRSLRWERLKAGGEGDDRGWVGWMVSLTRWTWIWASSRSWWQTGVLESMGSQRVRHDWVTELTGYKCEEIEVLPYVKYINKLYHIWKIVSQKKEIKLRAGSWALISSLMN